MKGRVARNQPHPILPPRGREEYKISAEMESKNIEMKICI